MKLIALLSPYLVALILTLMIEGILCLLLLRSKPWLRFVCLVNLFTNPLVNAIYTILYSKLAVCGRIYLASRILFILELFIWICEAYLFYRFGQKQKELQGKPVSSIYKALAFSLILNSVSYGTGVLLQL